MTKPPIELVAAGQTAHQIHQEVKAMIRPGLNLLAIEEKVKDMTCRSGMQPAFLGYHGYPATSCLSVNSVVVHGIPTNYTLRVGDVVTVDIGVKNGGWIVDTALTHPVGQISAEATQLIEITKKSLTEAIKQARAGRHVGDISFAIQQIVEAAGFYIIRELTGHGVGKKLQMPPSIPNHGRAGNGPELKEGMILAIEPITALKPVKVTIDNDKWTISASPAVVCAHFEHTVFVTQGDPVILTAPSSSQTG